MSLSLREVNIRFPYLKVLFLVGVGIGVVVGVTGLLRWRGSGERVEVTEKMEPEVAEQEEKGVENEPKEESTEEKEVVQEDDVQKEEEAASVKRDLMGKKLIVLSFDDGPSRTTTTRLLGILQEKNVVANFFVVGKMAEVAPELLAQEVAQGHEVGSHTVTHVNLAKATPENMAWEENRMKEIFRETVGKEFGLLRPPYGAVNDQVRRSMGQPMVLWSIDPEDWKVKNTAEVIRRVRAAAFDGAIILLHDIYATTVDAVSQIIDGLRADGYEFVTVSELASLRGVKMEKGWTYGSFRP